MDDSGDEVTTAKETVSPISPLQLEQKPQSRRQRQDEEEEEDVNKTASAVGNLVLFPSDANQLQKTVTEASIPSSITAVSQWVQDFKVDDTQFSAKVVTKTTCTTSC